MNFVSKEAAREEAASKFQYDQFSEARREAFESPLQMQSQRRPECLPGQLPRLCIEENGLLDGAEDKIKSPGSVDYSKAGVYKFGEHQRFIVMNDGTQVFESRDNMLIVSGGKLTTVGNVEIEDVELEMHGMSSSGKKVTFEDGSVAIVHNGYIAAVGDERSRRRIRYIPREVQTRH